MPETIIQGTEWHHARLVQGRKYRLEIAGQQVCGVAVAEVTREIKLYGRIPGEASWGVRIRTDDGFEQEIAWEDISDWNGL